MKFIHFANKGMFLLLWIIPLLIGFFIWSYNKRKSALTKFADINILPKLNVNINENNRIIKFILYTISIIFLIFALVRPGWNPKPKKIERTGRNIVFVLDVSKSMLAEDLSPNRLERAKLAILDCVDKLQGDKIALVVFAGSSVIKCPLTLDYGFFKTMLKQVSVDSVSRGGTLIGDAIRTKVLDAIFDKSEKKYRDIILITDGEDHDSFPVEAAQECGRRGIRLIVIGIGDEYNGAYIPITDEQGQKTFLTYQGEKVRTKLDSDTLRKMANATPGGVYIPVKTGNFDLGDIYTKLIASAEKTQLDSQTIEMYEEKFQIFLGIALLFLIIELLINERKKRSGVNVI